ncbi:MAG: hypothetical protein QME70_04755 [Bacillota bacterium]|nr:hypothetical protein [Bacillota bacterium]
MSELMIYRHLDAALFGIARDAQLMHVPLAEELATDGTRHVEKIGALSHQKVHVDVPLDHQVESHATNDPGLAMRGQD